MVPFRGRDGREVWVSMFVSPVVEDGRVVQHFASFLDISERVARERDLREAKAALDRRVATRTERLRQANARLQEEVERWQRTEGHAARRAGPGAAGHPPPRLPDPRG